MIDSGRLMINDPPPTHQLNSEPPIRFVWCYGAETQLLSGGSDGCPYCVAIKSVTLLELRGVAVEFSSRRSMSSSHHRDCLAPFKYEFEMPILYLDLHFDDSKFA